MMETSPESDIVEEAKAAARCSICLEPTTALTGGIVALGGCGHEFCTECLEVWFLQQERAGRSESAAVICPACRRDVHDDDIRRVLGRTLYEPGDENDGNGETSPSTGSDTDDDLDEFTMTYLEERGAKRCPECRIWVIREDGCDNIMCRCGCRFCYCCGRKGACQSVPFYNNFADLEEEDSYEWDPETESCAGEVWPLFGEDWWSHWFPERYDYDDDDYCGPCFGYDDDDEYDDYYREGEEDDDEEADEDEYEFFDLFPLKDWYECDEEEKDEN